MAQKAKQCTVLPVCSHVEKEHWSEILKKMPWGEWERGQDGVVWKRISWEVDMTKAQCAFVWECHSETR